MLLTRDRGKAWRRPIQEAREYGLLRGSQDGDRLCAVASEGDVTCTKRRSDLEHDERLSLTSRGYPRKIVGDRSGERLWVIRLRSYDHVSPFVPAVHEPVGVADVVQGECAIDHDGQFVRRHELK